MTIWRPSRLRSQAPPIGSTAKPRIAAAAVEPVASEGGPELPQNYPYMVSLRDPDDSNAHICCDGVLIRPTVVTAAHCLKEGRPSPLVHIWIDQDQGFEVLSVARALSGTTHGTSK